MKTLDEISLSCDTDKGSKFHNYTKIYEKYFESIRDSEVNLLEIGVSRGGSLDLWERYFQNGKFVGVDINKDCLKYKNNRSEVRIGNQFDKTFLTSVCSELGPFDIIIDDGYHSSDSIIIGFETMWPYLKSGGFYVIEDIHCVYIQEPGRKLMEYFNSLLGHINMNGKTNIGNFDKIDKTKLSDVESTIESITHYTSLSIIKKR
jgi:ubiquinone/menaquinone biosynthesis C-methylase UbiE